MQEMIVVQYCDVCFNRDNEKHLADEYWGVINGEMMEVDLCLEMYQGISHEDFQRALADHGRPASERNGNLLGVVHPPKQEKSAKPRVPCPHPDCMDTGRTYKNRSSLSAHFNQAHGMTHSQWKGEQEGKEPQFECEAKGCKEKFYSPQARTGHMQQAHGWTKEGGFGSR